MSESPVQRPKGWLVGLAIALIFFGTFAGVIGVGIYAKRQQRFRIPVPESRLAPAMLVPHSNSPSTLRQNGTN